MSETFTARVWVLGDDIDTDIIIPTEYLALKTIDDMKQYGFSPLRPELAGSDPARRYHRSRQELRLRLFQRAGTGDHQGAGHPLQSLPSPLPGFSSATPLNNGLLLIENSRSFTMR